MMGAPRADLSGESTTNAPTVSVAGVRRPSLAPLRAAMIGTGAWANVLATAARNSCIALVTCYSPNAQRRQAFAESARITATDAIERIWDDATIDAVIIAAPNELHRPLAEAAARHGKHIFVEKPIAHTVDDALAMIDASRIHGVTLVVGHCARMLAGNRAIAKAIANGDLGRVAHIEAYYANDRALKLTRNDWRWYDAKAPGGPLSQIGIHQFDTLRALGGDIEAVSARSAKLSPAGAEVADQWTVNTRFADGKLGTVVTSWTSPGHYSVRATGDRASVYYEIDQSLWSQPTRLHEHAVLERQARGDGPDARTRVPVPPGDMFRDELELFAEAVASQSECELSADNALRALAAVEAAITSDRRHGAEVLLDEVISVGEHRLRPALSQHPDLAAT